MLRRSFQTALAAAAAVVLASSTAFGDTSLQRLMGYEERGIDALPKDRVEKFLGTPKSSLAYSRDWIDSQKTVKGGPEWRCLAEALYFEARGESVKGQFAVAEVIMNRVEHAQFPDTVCGVVHQGTGRKYGCQFTYTCDGHAEVISEPRAFTRVGKVAQMAIKGKTGTLTKGATHYHTRAVNPRWARVYPRVATIGVHHFYRRPTRVSSN
ncbi:cell wall hydrolase [Rhodobacteraceae bacterium KMM 6894]|nr:cell wall hydrolase [Rhodobacteraceae bacterium KMM 6894]